VDRELGHERLGGGAGEKSGFHMLKTARRANPKWVAQGRECMRLRGETTLSLYRKSIFTGILTAVTLTVTTQGATVATVPAVIQTSPF
jgi:hypothetical protein